MLGKRQKLKYEAVESEEETDFDEKKRGFCNPACFWSSLFTAILIGTYYIPSICLTFYQRWLLQVIETVLDLTELTGSFQSFHFPLMTVVVHMIVKFLLSMLIRVILEKKQGKQRILLGWKEYIVAVAPMGLFSGLDIGFSNWGLELIQVSLYTMTKSTTIVFILGFSILFKLEKKSWSLVFIVVMITVGLILFTYKATQFDILGFSLLLLASISSGIRWTCVQLLLQKSKMGMRNPVDMIYHMQPWMLVSVLPFAMWMEGPAVIKNCQLFRYTDMSVFINTMSKVLVGAFIAFFMEMSEVLVEVFVLVLAVEWNGDKLSGINVLGLLICLSGITCHVLHKLKTSSHAMAKTYEVQAEHHELGEQLILNEDTHYDVSSESDERSDTQILFNILKSHDR
ncbi:solute carrier family 35 member C2 [Asbolus verrucosus]|uniref:Solute carrier family 35 member C2 n=1 Tax=Asbolus verrucosus TaxID=1661398 RepID=A0A482VBR0_ASBVE|nr:solute carrier family 35 member C2 [Asbolus verrucosus]